VELEQRVKTLEYEVKILKNEVQRTLLDIQEQILIHYYPVLRTEETAPSAGIVQALETVRVQQRPKTAAPSVKQVSLDEVRETENGHAIGSMHMQLLRWSVHVAAKFGSKRAQKIIELYGARGAFSPEVRDSLIELAVLGEHAEPTKIVMDDLVRELNKLNELLGHVIDAEGTRALIKEVNLG